MKSKDIAIVGILLAVGAILRYFLAMLHTPLTPNMIIAFYCLAIILIQPKVYEALGIGIVAGVLSMLISSSMFPRQTLSANRWAHWPALASTRSLNPGPALPRQRPPL